MHKQKEYGIVYVDILNKILPAIVTCFSLKYPSLLKECMSIMSYIPTSHILRATPALLSGLVE